MLEGGNFWLGKYAREGLLGEWEKQVVAREVLRVVVEEMEVVWRCVCVEVVQACVGSGVLESEEKIVEWGEGGEEEGLFG